MEKQKPEYKAAPGKEDRHGEMTGAISFNLVLCCLPLILFIFLLNPYLFESVIHQAIAAVIFGTALFFGMFPISRRIWTIFSDFVDNPDL